MLRHAALGEEKRPQLRTQLLTCYIEDESFDPRVHVEEPLLGRNKEAAHLANNSARPLVRLQRFTSTRSSQYKSSVPTHASNKRLRAHSEEQIVERSARASDLCETTAAAQFVTDLVRSS